MKKRNTLILGLALIGMTLISCKKAENGEVIENTYTGNVTGTSTGSDPGGDFTGTGDNGVYKFAWENKKTKAEVNFDITSSSGSVTMTLQDKKDTEVFNQTLTAGQGDDSYSGISTEGKSGIWTVTISLTDFNGDGSYSLSPID